MIRSIAAILILVSCVVLATAHAQVFIHDFQSDPVGTTLKPLWREARGDWAVTRFPVWKSPAPSKERWLECLGTGNDYPQIVASGLKFLNCCVECVVQHPGRGYAASGMTLRAINPTFGIIGTDLVLVYVDGQYGRFERLYLGARDASGGPAHARLTFSPTRQLTLRLIAAGKWVFADIDIDQDGRWDRSTWAQTYWTPKTGPNGFIGYRGGRINNYRLWDGVIHADPGNPWSTIGAVLKFKLFGVAGQPYLAATSLGRSGIILGNGSRLPLSVDSFFLVSVGGALPHVFRKYSGLMDSNGEATISLAIPKIQALRGLLLHTAFVCHRHPYFLAVSNEHQSFIH